MSTYPNVDGAAYKGDDRDKVESLNVFCLKCLHILLFKIFVFES